MQKAGSMKRWLICALLICSCCVMAVHPGLHRHRLPRRLPHCRLSWKQITAGGAAVGTVVSAYNISSGMENSLERASEKEPLAFLRLWAWIPEILAGLGIFALYKWYQKNKNERTKNGT